MIGISDYVSTWFAINACLFHLTGSASQCTSASENYHFQSLDAGLFALFFIY